MLRPSVSAPALLRGERGPARGHGLHSQARLGGPGVDVPLQLGRDAQPHLAGHVSSGTYIRLQAASLYFSEGGGCSQHLL